MLESILSKRSISIRITEIHDRKKRIPPSVYQITLKQTKLKESDVTIVTQQSKIHFNSKLQMIDLCFPVIQATWSIVQKSV